MIHWLSYAQIDAKLAAFLREEAEIYVEAYLAKDYDTCFGMMNADLIRRMGGKMTVLNHFQQTEEALKQRHMKFESSTVEKPRSLVHHGENEQFAVIPELQYYMGKDGNRYVLHSYVLAVSEDKGRTWSYIEGSWRIPEHIKARNVALYDRLHLPTRKLCMVDDPKIMLVEKGNSFVTPIGTVDYKEKLRERADPIP
jgi:hypothetical protein